MEVQRKRRPKADDDEEDEQARDNKRKIIFVILIISVIVSLVIFCISRILRNNRKFNKEVSFGYKTINPSVVPEDILKTYSRSNNDYDQPKIDDSKHAKYGKYNVIGLDFSQLKPGSLIFTRSIRAVEKDTQMEFLTRLIPSVKWTKKWRDPTLFKMVRQVYDVEGIIQQYVGTDCPSHIMMVAKVTRQFEEVGTRVCSSSDGTCKEFTIDDYLSGVEIWDFTYVGRSVRSLREQFEDYQCTQFMYWVAHLNRPVYDPYVSMIEKYVDKHVQPKMPLLPVFKNYLVRSNGICIESRRMFFEEMERHVVTNSITSEISETSASIIVFAGQCEKTKANLQEIYDSKIPCNCSLPHNNGGYVVKSGDVELLEKNCELRPDLMWMIDWENNGSLSSGNFKGWDDWHGIHNDYYSCSAMVYAVLELLGVVLPMSDCLSFHRRGCTLEAGYNDKFDASKAIINSSFGQRRDFVFNPTDKLRIMAPQYIQPCDFLRADFQWSQEYHIQTASRMFFGISDE